MEGMVDVELNLGKELADKIRKMTKKDLIDVLVAGSLRAQVQDETILSLEKEKSVLSAKLDKAESSIEQAQAMIKAVMDRWYHYDA